ncbi:selenoprotein Pb-like [Crotalus adamanteus]|uniref:Selenoprotein Pb-like n=1 Tax=Crotalus adamanteus TaxID=8729 RepID=A0AAW1BSC9_CROAD
MPTSPTLGDKWHRSNGWNEGPGDSGGSFEGQLTVLSQASSQPRQLAREIVWRWAMYWELKRHAPKGIPVYQQQILEPDVWQILKGNKDDFLIYDRCKKLTFHIQLPYSFLHLPYVEAAVRYTYHKDYCGNCSWYYLNSSQEVNNAASTPMMTTEAPRDKADVAVG